MNINILFVDDDLDVINGYKRMLFLYRKEWNQYFASGGAEALGIMEANNIDVIISDMKMPNMDGLELLNIVQKRFPNTLRIILSGHQDELKIIRSLTSAHQFLIKPCDANQIKKTIENAFSLRKLLENKEVIDIINGLGELPSLPEIYLKLEREMSSENVSFQKMTQIITKDPALTAKILQTVNSGFFGLPRRITDLIEALSYLGINMIKSIILYLETFSLKNYPPGVANHITEIATHCMETAAIGKIISKYEKLNKQLADDIFISCILHEVGKLILLKMPDYVSKIEELRQAKNLNWIEAETEIYGFTHESVGAYLLGIWGLPKTIIESAAFLHNPSVLDIEALNCLTIVHISNSLAEYTSDEFNYNELNIDRKLMEKLMLIEKIGTWWEEVQNYKRSFHE